MSETKETALDYFISYADADREWAEGVLTDALRDAGFKCLTPRDFEPGKSLLQSFEDAVTLSRQTVLVLSPAYLMDNFTRFSDQLAQHYGAELATWPVIPVYYKPVDDLPLRIRMLNPLDATHQEDWNNVIQTLVGQKPLQKPETPPPPYRGLRPFAEADREFFFGRERDVQDALNLLRAYPFLALIGPSGSGKSSLVYAGLLPSLRKSQVFGAGSWLVVNIRPGADPLSSLATALRGDPLQPQVSVPNLLAIEPTARRLLLIVDQYEELFTVSTGDVTLFQRALLDLVQHQYASVLLTIRADFYPDLMSSLLWPEIREHRFEIPPLNEESMSQAIRKPAEKVGVYVEAALIERLVSDARDEPGVMPFVQETMILLWDKIVRRFLPLSAYEALVLPRTVYGNRNAEEITGLEAAITLHAEAVLSRLDQARQAIARRIFIRLVHFGEGRPNTRRQQPQAALLGGNDQELFDKTLSYLAEDQSRLLALTGEEGDTPKVDIAHEALITAPSSIRAWIEEGRADELFRRELREDALRWVEANKNVSYLYESTKLQNARAWADRFHEEIDDQIQSFLNECDQHDKKRRWQQGLFLALVGLFALFGLSSAGYFIRLELLKQAARSPMVSFPEGPAVFGYEESRVEGVLPAFQLEKFEVSIREYGSCIAAQRCTPPNVPYVEGAEEPGDDLPVTWVTAYQAATFCDWIGRRLPTVKEWERAVRGTEGRTWPWGEASPIDPSLRVHIFLSDWPDIVPPNGPVAVDDKAYALGVSPEGIWHLLGNAAEWTSTYASHSTCPDPYGKDCPIWDGKSTKVQALYAVGLGWAGAMSSDEKARVSAYYPASPISVDPAIGFRCADS